MWQQWEGVAAGEVRFVIEAVGVLNKGLMASKVMMARYDSVGKKTS